MYIPNSAHTVLSDASDRARISKRLATEPLNMQKTETITRDALFHYLRCTHTKRKTVEYKQHSHVYK